jgi:hypothetical protein
MGLRFPNNHVTRHTIILAERPQAAKVVALSWTLLASRSGGGQPLGERARNGNWLGGKSKLGLPDLDHAKAAVLAISAEQCQ